MKGRGGGGGEGGRGLAKEGKKCVFNELVHYENTPIQIY